MEHLVYFILLALLCEILGTVGGFGSSLFFVPIAGFFLDFQSVLGTTASKETLQKLINQVKKRCPVNDNLTNTTLVTYSF